VGTLYIRTLCIHAYIYVYLDINKHIHLYKKYTPCSDSADVLSGDVEEEEDSAGEAEARAELPVKTRLHESMTCVCGL